MNKNITRRNLIKKMGLTAGGITMGSVPILANNAVVTKRNP
ncbi:MAG: hypothetical protein ACI9IP_003056, partial [Arcticibacterium sp.]